ncbi:Diacylglycerol O-acyltransferase 1 [Clonorchis sinensis]|uniref:O-acyltransferase n=2 Tax=Clonorchis sinensis TaxID=79923 RepID=A0A8T1M1Y1_CLOSI|nr:Diacylglycerol O-acyltransferase 1 [Clonorchis sinensis]
MKTTRALSHGNLADYEVMNEYHFKNSPDRPIHRSTQSLLTTTSGFNNFRGLFNWGAFLLVITTSRMALENIIKYGVVMDPTAWLRFILQTPDKYYALGLLLCCNLFIIAAWFLEYAVVRGMLHHNIAIGLGCINLFCVLIFPTVIILTHDFNPLFSSPVLMVYTVLFLKLWSYLAVNRWCRLWRKKRMRTTRAPLLAELKKRREVLESEKRTRRRSQGDSECPLHVDMASGRRDLEIENADVLATSLTTQNSDGSQSVTEVRNRRVGQIASPVKLEETVNLKDYRFELEGSKSSSGLASGNRLPVNRASMSVTDEYRTLLDMLELERHPLAPFSECIEVAFSGYVTYPNNITLSNLYYFIFAPTLCYELNFPRTLTIRKAFLLKRLFELLFLTQLIFCLAQQWMLPTLRNSVAPISKSDFSQIIERCLKLAIPNHLIWLLFFYASFHSLFNAVGELLRFGDRFFYSDWWNAETVPAFWSKWNIPVHRFARRHIYLPLLGFGLTRPQAGIVVFFISAVLHEFLISIPLKMLHMWAFFGMLSQMPYAQLVKRLFPNGGAWGNVAVWMTLIIGQPLAMLFYFHDYYLVHYVTSETQQ